MQWITCGDHVMPRFRSGTPDTAEPLLSIKKIKMQINENVSKSQTWITLILSKEYSLLKAERFEGDNCP